MPRRYRREFSVRFSLIPVANRSYIRFLCKVSSSLPPAKVLYGYFQVFVKPYRIHNMPAVHPEALHHIIMPIPAYYLVKTCIRSTEFGIIDLFNTCGILLPGVKIIRAAEIIFRSCAAYCREFGIAVHEEFDFTFAPPAVICHGNLASLPERHCPVAVESASRIDAYCQ